jgi:hypothetical protein
MKMPMPGGLAASGDLGFQSPPVGWPYQAVRGSRLRTLLAYHAPPRRRHPRSLITEALNYSDPPSNSALIIAASPGAVRSRHR